MRVIIGCVLLPWTAFFVAQHYLGLGVEQPFHFFLYCTVVCVAIGWKVSEWLEPTTRCLLVKVAKKMVLPWAFAS